MEELSRRETKPPVEDSFALEEVDLSDVRRDIEKKRKELPKKRKSLFVKKILPLLLAAAAGASFLSACDKTSFAQEVERTQERVLEVVEHSFESMHEEMLRQQHELTSSFTQHEYEAQEFKIIEDIESRFNIDVSSPTVWKHLLGPEAGKFKENLLWTREELSILREALDQLPPEFINNNKNIPKEIVLVKSPGNYFILGNYGDQRMELYTLAEFSSDLEYADPVKKYVKNAEESLTGAVVHEFAHSFHESHPEVLDEWTKQTGWLELEEGLWFNPNRDSLIPYGDADSLPYEDFAFSTQLMLTNPDVLSQDRTEFFLDNPHFKDWSAVETYQQR